MIFGYSITSITIAWSQNRARAKLEVAIHYLCLWGDCGVASTVLCDCQPKPE